MSKKPLSFTNIRVPYFSNDIELNHFEDVEIKDLKGSGSPGNIKSFRILAENGNDFFADNTKGVMLKNVK